jgi:hypothetical protein
MWVVWAVSLVPHGAAASIVRVGVRLLAWGHDPAGLIRGGGAVGASMGLASASLLALAAWLVGLRFERRRRLAGRRPDTSGRVHRHKQRRD